MVALLERRGNSARAVRAASGVSTLLSQYRGLWDACSGRHCGEVGRVLYAVNGSDKTVVHLDDPQCASLIGPGDREALAKLNARSPPDALKGVLGEVAFSLFAMGCVEGVPARHADSAAVSASIGNLPAQCPRPSSADLRAMLAAERNAILTGCAPRPWPSPP